MTYQLVPKSDLVPAYDDRAGTQARSDITALADGGAVVVYTQVVWRLDSYNDSDFNVRDYDMIAQRYDADGVAIDAPVVIDTLIGTPQRSYDVYSTMYPVVTGLEDGGYAVGWRDPAVGGAHVRSYDADGTMRGETIVDLPAHDVGGGREAEVSADGGGAYTITALDTGGFAFTWGAGYTGILAQYGGAKTIYSQTFTSEGAAIGTPSSVTPFVGTGAYSIDRWNFIGDSVPLTDGRYIVFMRGGEGAPGNTSEFTAILGRIYDQNGVALTDSFMINEDVDTWHDSPSATAMPDGGFVVTWRGDVSGWRRFDADGEPVTGDMDLDSQYGDTNVTAMDDGGFLITGLRVSSGGAAYTTYGQRIDENNEAVGERFVITSNRSPDPDIVTYVDSPELITLGNGKIMGLIEGSATDSSGLEYDVMVRLYLPDALGTAADDQLTASAGGTAVFGRDGDDLLQGESSADYLDGENGNDTIMGAAGNDTLVAGDGNDSLDGGAGDDVVIEGPGNDTMIGGDGNDTAVFGVRVANVTVRGPEVALVISYEGSSDVVQGFETFEFKDAHYTDTLTLAEVLELRNIYTYGDSTDDLIYGDYGNDTLIGSYGNDTIFGEAGDDSLEGGAGNDELNGGTGNDALKGGADDDVLNGDAGDDVLDAGYGDDTLDGGEGNDTAVFYGFSAASAIVSGPDDALTVAYDSYYNNQANVVRNVETFQFEPFNNPVEVLTLAELLALRNRDITGTDEDDVLIGDYGNDTIRGGDGDDRLEGRAGDDRLYGEAGADTLIGGDGDDLLDGGSGNDKLIGGEGNDTLRGGEGADVLNGTSGNNLIEGGSLSDTIYGGSGDDTIDGGIGNDSLWGLAGDDLIFGDLGSDTIVGADGDDNISGGGLSDEIHGGNGADFINGGWGYDRLRGGADADTFFHLGIYDHGSDWVQDYNAAEGDVLRTGRASTTADQYLVQFAHTADAQGVRSGDADVMEAFVVYRATGQILWALVDGAGQDEINLQAAPDLVFDIM